MPEAERQFAERMRNVKLVGSFTVDGREPRPPRGDGYEISSVEKVGDNCGGSTPGSAWGWHGRDSRRRADALGR